MRLLKNKHFVLAMIIAPVLAVIAYFATNYVVSEPPQAAQAGQSYKLAAKSNCRYQSGLCTLKNGDIEIYLQAKRRDDRTIMLTLNSDQQIQQAIISITSADGATTPTVMTTPNATTEAAAENQWQLEIDVNRPEKSHFRLAVNIANAIYYAEMPAIFVDYETTFSRENFSSEKG